MFRKYFLPVCHLSFHFLNSVIERTVLNFDEFQFHFFFYHPKKFLYNPHYKDDSVFSSEGFITSGFICIFVNHF